MKQYQEDTSAQEKKKHKSLATFIVIIFINNSYHDIQNISPYDISFLKTVKTKPTLRIPKQELKLKNHQFKLRARPHLHSCD